MVAVVVGGDVDLADAAGALEVEVDVALAAEHFEFNFCGVVVEVADGVEACRGECGGDGIGVFYEGFAEVTEGSDVDFSAAFGSGDRAVGGDVIEGFEVSLGDESGIGGAGHLEVFRGECGGQG